MIKLPKNSKDESGQTLVLIILVVMIALTVGIAVSSQAIINSRQTRTEEQSAQAYAAAESGIENALLHLKTCTNDCIVAEDNPDGEGTLNNGSNYDYYISSTSLLDSDTVYEVKIEKDDVVQIDLTSNGAGALLSDVNVSIYFWCEAHPDGNSDDPSDGYAALEYTFLVNDGGTYKIQNKEVFDGDPIRRSSNFFNAPSGGDTIALNRVYDYLADDAFAPLGFSFNTGSFTERLLRIRPWYKDTWVAIKLTGTAASPAPSDFSNQGYEIRSTGNIDNVERTIVVTRSNPYLPAIFDYVLFSGGDLTK